MRSNINIKRVLQDANTELQGSDSFLGKDVLTLANKINSSRNMMFNSHLEQLVVLNKPEFPRVFTNYENEVGRFSSSYLKTDKSLEIVAKLRKFKNNDSYYILVVRDKNNHYDIVERKIGERLTESYCYTYDNDVIDGKRKGDTIKKGEVLWQSTSFDKNMNYCYGVNCNAVYMINNDTIEDAIVVSESFAEKLASSYIHEVEVNINNNDILCNLYGDDKDYRGFPDIGEMSNDRVLVARRRITYSNALYDLMNENIKKINYNTDTTFYSKGRLIDIDIYCNQDIEKIEKYSYNQQIVKYLKGQNEFYSKVVKVLKPIVEDPKATCGHDLLYFYRRAKDILDPQIKWKQEKNDFDNIVIVFRILEENKLHVGSKIAGRFADKGVISKILPDDKMPIAENGTRVDAIFNALGIINRLNPGQLYELELNFISDHIVLELQKKKGREREDYFFDYIGTINKVQCAALQEYYKALDKEGKKEFWQSIFTDGIFIHQPPFWGNVNFDQLRAIYEKYDWIKPYTCFIEGKQISQPLIIGKKYIIRMKHEPSGKFSARSTSYLNMKNIPSKSLKYKKHQALHSNTPIREGEMEIANQMLTQNPDEVMRMLSMYSSSEDNRAALAEHILTEPNCFDKPVQLKNPWENNNRKILDVCLKSLSTELKDIPVPVESFTESFSIKKKKKKKKVSQE